MVKKKVQTVPPEVKKEMIDIKDELTISEQCRIIDFPRSKFYQVATGISSKNLNIMRLIDEIYTEDPVYGSRRIQAELNLTHGISIGRTKVRGFMREMGIQAIYPKKRLTIAEKGHKKYPYLLRNLSIDRVNQVWSTDITYIRMEHGFVYLAAVIDWYSRKVLSWKLSISMDQNLCTSIMV